MEKYTHWYTDVLKKYAVIEGRATRQEYWMFFLLNLIVSILVSIVALLINFKGLSSLYSLALFLPSMTVLIRRLHDTNRSGWWALLILAPIIGWIALFIFLVQKSLPGPNSYDTSMKKTDTQTQAVSSAPIVPIEEKIETPSAEVPETKTSEQ